MFAVAFLFLVLGAALIAHRARGGRVSRLVLMLFAAMWSPERLDRKAEARRRASRRAYARSR